MHLLITTMVEALKASNIHPTRVSDFSQLADGSIKIDDVFHISVAEDKKPYGVGQWDGECFTFFPEVGTPKEAIECYKQVAEDWKQHKGKEVFRIIRQSDQHIIFEGYGFGNAYGSWFGQAQLQDLTLTSSVHGVVADSADRTEDGWFDKTLEFELMDPQTWNDYQDSL